MEESSAERAEKVATVCIKIKILATRLHTKFEMLHFGERARGQTAASS